MDAEHHICVLLAPQDHKKFHVLKGVVEEWSPVLTAALLHHGSSSTDDCKTVILENFALEVIECFVRFLYHGRLDDNPAPELLWELALMGRYYDVPNLQDQCFAWLEYYACADHNNSQWLVPFLHDLPRHGFELHEVCKCCKGSHLLRRFRLTLSDFLDLRFNDTAAFDLEPAHVAKLVLSQGVCSLQQVTSDRISIATLLERGWRPEDVLLCGFTIDEIRSAGIRVTPRSLWNLFGGQRRQSKIAKTESVIAFGFHVDELLRDGFSSAWFQKQIDGSHGILRAAGYSVSDLLHLGYAPRLLART